MLKAKLCRISYIPVFSLYAVLPLFHDVMPNHNGYYSEDWIALAGMYALGTLISLPLFYLLKKADKSGVGVSTTSLFLRLLASISAQLICLYSLWENSIYLYLSMSVVMVLSAVLFAAGRKGFNLLKDKDTGSIYEVRGSKAYRLSDAEAAGYRTTMFGKGAALAEFSSSQYSGLDSNSTVIPVNFISSVTDINQGIAINPSSGMPMVGGISGLDIHGNSWGTNFNEPSNTYDPDRGY